MAEDLKLITGTKEDKYLDLIPQIKGLVDGETDTVANMANICAALKTAFGFFWVGFYLVKENQLVLGPFQGPVACTRIQKGKGVCGSSWQNEKAIIVANVDEFPGHIACSAFSKSEIVVPVVDSGKKIIAVLDVDSDVLNNFDTVDLKYLSEILTLLKF